MNKVLKGKEKWQNNKRNTTKNEKKSNEKINLRERGEERQRM